MSKLVLNGLGKSFGGFPAVVDIDLTFCDRVSSSRFWARPAAARPQLSG